MKLGEDCLGESTFDEAKFDESTFVEDTNTKEDREKQLKKLIQEELEIKKQKTELDTKESQVKAEIQYCMEVLGLDSYEDEFENVVTVKEMNRTGLDNSKVKEYLGERLSEFQKISTFTTVSVKSKEERERTKKFTEKK